MSQKKISSFKVEIPGSYEVVGPITQGHKPRSIRLSSEARQGLTIRYYRIKADLTIKGLALESGISHSKIGRVERFETKLTDDEYQDISQALGIAPMKLFLS